MNRQLRREQARLDKKQEKEKSRRRTSRRQALRAVRERRDAAAKRAAKGRDGNGAEGKPGAGKSGARSGRRPARFAGLFAVVAAIGLALLGVQAGVEREGANDVFDVVLFPLYFLMFGYFMAQWMMRRGSDRPLLTGVVTGVALALGIAVSQIVAPPAEIAGDAAQTTAWKVWLGLGLGVPALVGGSYLGRLVYTRSD